MIKTYDELIAFPTFKERFEYCRLGGSVGKETFGVRRWLNQVFYKGALWRDTIRPDVIARDLGRDLALQGCDIGELIIVHHLNPITDWDIQNHSEKLTDLNNLVCVSLDTHNAIHYGDFSKASSYSFVERSPNDTCPWRKNE